MTAIVVIRARRRPALPFCDVCKRPVERLEEEQDEFMQRRVFTARCHGRSERVILHFDESVESVDPGAGVAFKQPKALADAKK